MTHTNLVQEKRAEFEDRLCGKISVILAKSRGKQQMGDYLESSIDELTNQFEQSLTDIIKACIECGPEDEKRERDEGDWAQYWVDGHNTAIRTWKASMEALLPENNK